MAEINIYNFDLISNNIENNEGRGVALYIKKLFWSFTCWIFGKFFEDVWAAIKLQGEENWSLDVSIVVLTVAKKIMRNYANYLKKYLICSEAKLWLWETLISLI